MVEKDQGHQLLQRAQQTCSMREYCISDMRSLLGRWGAHDEKTTAWVLNKLVEDGFIDEERYARAFALDHFRHHHWGRVKITMALRGKKIKASAISSGLEAIDHSEYIDLLKKIISDQKKRISGRNLADVKGKLFRHALAKGFESHLIYDILNQEFSD